MWSHSTRPGAAISASAVWRAGIDGERFEVRGRAAGRADFHFHGVARMRRGAGQMEVRRAVVEVRRDAEGQQVRGVARLEEDGLPDAAGRRVPAPLFADGLLGVVHRVFHAQHDHRAGKPVRVRLAEGVGQVELERRVAALVVAERLAVAPAVREEIRRADGQDHALARPRAVARDAELAPVPADLVAGRGAVV